jgi:hypothetical protein
VVEVDPWDEDPVDQLPEVIGRGSIEFTLWTSALVGELDRLKLWSMANVPTGSANFCCVIWTNARSALARIGWRHGLSD